MPKLTPIEQKVVEEWDELIKVSTKLELRNWLTTLLLAHRAELQKAREEERERILEMIGHLPYVSQEEYKKYKNGGVIKWVTLKEHFTQPTPLTNNKE